jgi:hypothetical protein
MFYTTGIVISVVYQSRGSWSHVFAPQSVSYNGPNSLSVIRICRTCGLDTGSHRSLTMVYGPTFF